MWPDTRNTEQLIAQAREGNHEAAGDLLQRHRQSVRQMIELRMDQVLKRRVDASDIVQDVMIEAHRRLQTYLADPVMPFHLWLRQMAKDRLIDAHRRHRGAARRSIDREQPLATAGSRGSSVDLLGQLQDEGLTPSAEAAWRELQQRFHSACQLLEPIDQEIVFMRHFEHLTNQEAAVALKLSPQAASMRYLRAMRRLRELFDGDDQFTED